MLIDATNTNVEWADPTGEEAVWLATYTTPKVGGDDMRKLITSPEMRACNKINGEACERRMEDWIFIAELIGKLDNIDKYVKEDFFIFVRGQITSEEYMMHQYGHKSKREIIAREALENEIRKELENQK